MPLLIYQLVHDYLPAKRKQTQKGWWTFNAPCCHHRGHNTDTRSRGNLLFVPDGTIVVNCYNCGFKTRYRGSDITYTFEQWLEWIGVPKSKIQEAKLEILSKKLNGEIQDVDTNHLFKIEHYQQIDLPQGSKSIADWTNDGVISKELLACINYLAERGRKILTGYDYYWASTSKHNLNQRILIPFYYNNKIVGYTGRYAGTPPKGVPKYWNSDRPADYLFNNHVINLRNRKFVLILEGPFDAIAVDGVGTLGSKMNLGQINWLNSTDKEKIVVPDRQRKNQDLIDTALEQGWSVSFPDWDDKIKDAAEATMCFGNLYTLASILKTRTNIKLEIDVKRKLLKG